MTDPLVTLIITTLVAAIAVGLGNGGRSRGAGSAAASRLACRISSGDTRRRGGRLRDSSVAFTIS